MTGRYENALLLRGSPTNVAAARDALADDAFWETIDSIKWTVKLDEAERGAAHYLFESAGAPPIGLMTQLAAENPGLVLVFIHFLTHGNEGFIHVWQHGHQVGGRPIGRADLVAKFIAAYGNAQRN